MPKALAEKQDLLLILYWSSFVKIILGLFLAATLIILSMTHTLDFNAWPIIFVLIPLFIVTNAGLLLLAKRQVSWAGRLIYPEIFLNILIVTLFVYFSGEAHVNFLFLYIIPAFSASLVSLWALVAAFGLSIVFFGIEHYIVMTPGSDFSTFAKAVFYGDELGHFFLLTLIIAAIGFQARYYIGRIKEANEKLINLKDEFMFRTIHDLRGPATTVKFVIEKYSEEDFNKNIPKEILDDIKTVDGLNADLLAMIEELLLVAKGEQADVKAKIEPVNLKDVISPILSSLQKEISRKEIKLDHDAKELPLVLADRLRLREVFGNLLENAVKYNRKGGQFALGHEIKGKFLVTRIENTSVDSLTPDDLEKFFKPYAQIGRDEDPGTGLGLYIVKKLVEKMGGEISVTYDKDAEKISFYVSLLIEKN
jgi:signal transduction histidine kinase